MLAGAFGRILTIIRKEFIQILRDPRTLAIVLLMPPMQIILLGYAVNSDVKHVPTVVADQSHDAESRAFVQSFANTDYFSVVGYVDGPTAVRHAIDHGDARAGLIIPPDYGRNVQSQQQAVVQIVIDGSDPQVASTVNFAASAIAQSQSTQMLTETLERKGMGGMLKAPLDLRSNILYNPDLRSINYMIPGLIGLILQFQSLMLTAFAIVRERERGTLEQLIVTPIKPWELMLGKILPFALIAFWNVGIALLAGLLWFQVEFNGSFTLLLALSLLFLLSSLALGMLVSTVSRTQGQAMQLSIFIYMPAVIISGLVFPLENLPWPLYALSQLLPITHFLKILRGISLKGVGADYLASEIAILALFTVVMFAISAQRFQKKLA